MLSRAIKICLGIIIPINAADFERPVTVFDLIAQVAKIRFVLESKVVSYQVHDRQSFCKALQQYNPSELLQDDIHQEEMLIKAGRAKREWSDPKKSWYKYPIACYNEDGVRLFKYHINKNDRLELNMDLVDTQFMLNGEPASQKYSDKPSVKPLTSLLGLQWLPWWQDVRALSVNFHHITKICDTDLQHCNKLYRLDLWNNNIRHIEDTKPLKNLSILDMRGNELKGLPFLFAKWTLYLRELNLSNNKLRILPNLLSLVHLESIKLHGNELEAPPKLNNAAYLHHDEAIDISYNPVAKGKVGTYSLADYYKNFSTDKSTTGRHKQKNKRKKS